MNKSIQLVFLAVILPAGLLCGCAPESAPASITILPTLTPSTTRTPVTPTDTPIPPTVTLLPPTPTMILASNDPIQIGDYSIILENVRVEDVGWNPCGLSSSLALVVGVSEESGKLAEVGGLKVWFTDDQGNKLGESCQPTEIGTNLQGKQWLAWYVYISKPANGYFMHFPTGEIIDLSPLLP
jgi:hypothetical protein